MTLKNEYMLMTKEVIAILLVGLPSRLQTAGPGHVMPLAK